MFLEQYVGELVVAIITSASTWVLTRHKQRADTKKIEVEVLQKAIQVLNVDVVIPLQNRLKLSEERCDKISSKLTMLQNAFSKIYNCRHLPDCPIRIELRDQENRRRKGSAGKPSTNRQREPVDRKESDADSDSSIESDFAPEL